MNLIRYLHIVFAFLIYIIQLRAQEIRHYTKEVSLATDNDALVAWQISDRYYTFGIGIQFNFRTEKLLRLEKLFPSKSDYFFGTELRLEGYTPSNKSVVIEPDQQSVLNFDRPFAGILYGTLDATYVFKKSFFEVGLLAGVMGPLSQAEELQGWFHNEITGGSTFDGWRFQIPNQFIFNINTKIVYDLTPKSKLFDVFGMVETRLGNLHIDISPAVGLRIGKFGELYKSAAFGNSILSDKKLKYYLQSTIGGTITGFDATAQGNLFDRDYEFALDNISNNHITLTNGIFLSYHNISIGFDHFFTFGKVIPDTQHFYARSIVRFRF
ncbi:lipid A-modifier LpxR family protein [uncultured Aquimarina sp.]|uniref:lipid A-modifier LpxR family protein n=1 Tax=uncultured Aquimarina sp. TaxID=575652 RepID=UPI00260B1D70|nr:lipid A-modifier LpxR family protein [uncultured Aquimarina sp.]